MDLKSLQGKNEDLNKRLIVPVPFDEVRIIGSLVYEVEKKTREKAEKESGKRVKRFDSNFFHFTIYPILEESKDKKFRGISRGWYKNGPYVPAIDSFLVIIGGMEEHQHQNHVDSKERMLPNLIEFEGE